MQTPQKQFYTKKEAAEFSTLSIRSIDYLIAEGKLKASKVGGRVIVNGRSLTQLLEKGFGVYRTKNSGGDHEEA